MCQSMSDMQSCSSHWKLPSSLQWGTMLALALVACMPIMHAVAGLSAAELTTECSGHAYHHAPAFERGGWMAAGQPGSHQHQVCFPPFFTPKFVYFVIPSPPVQVKSLVCRFYRYQEVESMICR